MTEETPTPPPGDVPPADLKKVETDSLGSKRMKRSFWQRIGASGLTVSLAVHVLLVFIAAAFVVGAIGFHHVNGAILKRFEASANTRSHRWYRVYNEVSVLLFAAIVTEPPHVLLPVQLASAPRFPSMPVPEIVTASLAMLTSPAPPFSICNVAPLSTTVPSTAEPSEPAFRATRKPELKLVTPV